MANGGFEPRRERPTYVSIKDQSTEEMDSEFVHVLKNMKGHVIGKGGYMLNEIMQKSGAKVFSESKEEEGFTVYGNEEQRTIAKNLIFQKEEEVRSTIWERVEIEDEYKGLVIGKRRAILREISGQTGANLTIRDGEIYIIRGNEEQRKLAKVRIGTIVARARLMGIENQFNRTVYYIDSWNIPEDYKLKVEHVQHENRMLLPESHMQYRLTPAKHYEQQEPDSSGNRSKYVLKLMKDALVSLRKIKEGGENVMADMWCHFGTAVIRIPREENVFEGDWTTDEVTEKLQSLDDRSNWKMAFKEGVDLNERIFKENHYREAHANAPFKARYDLTYLTPSRHQLRCKVWVAHNKVAERLEDCQIPFSDVYNVLEEIHFQDEATRSRCRGWLVLKARKYLQADILFPGCKYDCTRLTIRGRTDLVTDRGLASDYQPDEQERNVLSTYLSQMTMCDEDRFELCLPENLPEEFYLTHKRLSKRTLFTSDSGFAVILSKEHTWKFIMGKEEYRELIDLHVHCEDWDRLLSSGVWEPMVIVKKIPEFLAFVKEVQGLAVNEVQRNELAATIPSEILARGPLAVGSYNRALDAGRASVKRVPIMLIGQHGAGKTSLKKSLKGILFDPEEDSTVGIDVDPSHFKVTTETWKTGAKEKDQNSESAISFNHHTAKWIADRLKEKSVSTMLETNTVQMECAFDSEINDIPSQPSTTEPIREADHIHTASDQDLNLDSGVTHVSTSGLEERNEEKVNRSTSHIPEEVAAVTEKLLQGDWEDNREDIYSTLWDFAGQSVYYVTHPLFMSSRAMYCLVYDLSLNPDELAEPPLKQGVYDKSPERFNPKTNLDYLDFWMMSVASLASGQDDNRNSSQSEGLAKKLPAVFLVCTHADTPYTDRDPRELAYKIVGCLRKKPYGTHLIDVFVVDNTKSGTESECSEVMRLRQEIRTTAKNLPHIKEDIPIKWLKFEKILKTIRESGQRYISLESAKFIASKDCSINEDKELETLINYLHDLRNLIHFDDSPDLNKLVILDPQWLIDVFKRVITVQPAHKCTEKKLLELWLKLEEEGILDENLLAHVWKPLFEEKDTCDSLIAIMEKFSLLCPLSSDASGSKSYLVPSMLKSHPPKEIGELVASAKMPSLFLKFRNGHVPPGLFPRLVLQFFQWGEENNFWGPERSTMFHNFARFFTSDDEECSVILLSHSSSVEVVVHRVNVNLELAEDLSSKMTMSADLRNNTTAVTCARAVRRQLGLMLECMRKEFCWLRNMKYEMSVICPVCCCGRAVNYCHTHHKQRCQEEQCIHFWTLSELRSNKKNANCTRSATAENCRVPIINFTHWLLPSEHQLAVDDRGGRCPSSGEGKGGKALAVSDKVLESLSCHSSDSKQIVNQWKESFQLDQSSLEQPDPETKALVRCLTRTAIFSNRLDVVQHLREISPAGTTGPVLHESLDVRGIPNQQARQLTVILSGGDEWKLVAEKLGLNADEIRFLDKRTLNPADGFLAYVARQRHLTVGDLYDVLCECGLPVMADKL